MKKINNVISILKGWCLDYEATNQLITDPILPLKIENLKKIINQIENNKKDYNYISNFLKNDKFFQHELNLRVSNFLSIEIKNEGLFVQNFLNENE